MCIRDSDTSAKIRLAWALRRQGKHSLELGKYQSILTEHPAHLLALSGTATSLARMGRLGEARDTFDALQILAPVHPLTETTAATLEAIQGRDDLAIESLSRAVVGQEHLDTELQIEFRQDLALDPALARVRKSTRLRSMLRRTLGAAAPRSYRQ